MMKRRKHTKMEVQPVDGWKLVMSLKSGLLMESTWALDALNILLYDDNAFTYFGLSNMPGLMEAVLEHWRSSLIAMFGITEDLELPNAGAEVETRTRKRLRCDEEAKNRKWFETKSATAAAEEMVDTKEEPLEIELGIVGTIDPNDKCNVLSGNDYSKRPRFSEEEVEFEEKDEELFVTDAEREWDTTVAAAERTTGSSEHWLRGGGDSTSHIVPPFFADFDGLVPFVRLLKEMSPLTEKKRSSPAGKKAKSEKKVKEEEEKVGATSKEIKSEAPDEDNKDHDVKPGESFSSGVGASASAEDIVDRIHRLTGIVLRDPDAARSRWQEESREDECYMRDEPSLHLVSESQDTIGKRVVCVSTILRNLSFVPGNEYEFSRNAAFLTIAGRLLLFCHWYPKRTPKQRNYDRGDKAEDEDASAESCTSLASGENEWWWDYLHVIRENVMVVLANISGSLELAPFDEDIVRPVLHGLLEWSVSSSSYAQDPFPYVGANSQLSPQRLAIETLTKLCLHETNVDLILTTPPYSRIVRLTRFLAKKLYRYEDQVLREFSINMLYYLSAADSGVSRTIATADHTIGLLLGFIEQAEQNAMVVAQQHGVNALRDNPDSMGTSLDMLRRAASTLHNLSRHPDNIPLFVTHEQRLLCLVMSQILDQGVASILSNVLFNIGAEQQGQQEKGSKKDLRKGRKKSGGGCTN
jgi:AT-rich interactive domain-containing protein 1